MNKQYNTDIEIVQCGWEKCESGHFFGPAVRDHFLVHYVVEGKGIFKSGGKQYPIQKGGGFLICPEQLTYYEADGENPWHYIWIGFTGVKAQELLRKAGLSEKGPVFHESTADDIFRGMVELQGSKAVEVALLAQLYSFFALMAQNTEHEETAGTTLSQQYVAQAIQYIKNNYPNKISIKHIADTIGLNRSYFYEIFKAQTGVSPQQYLITYRIERACKLLKETNLRVSDIARSVGYDDEFTFTRIFASKKGASPTRYKKQTDVQQ